MLNLLGKHKCFHCGDEFEWSILYKEASAPYTETSGRVRIQHSGHSEVNRRVRVDSYAFVDDSMLSIDTRCTECGMVNRVLYQIDNP